MLLRKLTAALIEKLLTIDKGAKLDFETGAQIRVRAPNGGAISKTIDLTELGVLDGITATATEINRAADVSGRVVDLTAATLTVTEATHDGKVITVNKADGSTLTLPAATGSGAKITVFIGTTVTSNAVVVQVADATDVMAGTVWMANDTDNSVSAFETAADSDTITMNGSTKGGIKGDKIELVDVASNLWSVQAFLQGTGTEATPFSAAVA